MAFQLLQSINWFRLLKKHNNLFSFSNLPYYIFSCTVTIILGYFFYITNTLSIISTIEDAITVALDMSIWVFTIISLGTTKNSAVGLLALGSLMIVSSDLTFTCLFMFDMNNVALTVWPHLVWTGGMVMMTMGFLKSKIQEDFRFHEFDSIHVKCNGWVLIASLVAFLIGLILPFFFIEAKKLYTIRYALWDVPISLMCTMILSTLLSNRFSKVMLSPIQSFSQSIEYFNLGKEFKMQAKTDINEFKILREFINKSFTEITEKLEQEVKISAQVAHDVRSPLSALEIGIKSLPHTFDESKKILLRDAVEHIKDITNMLDKSEYNNNSNETKHTTQIAVLLDNVISERRLALSQYNIKFKKLYDSTKYGYFVNVIPSLFKRILTNILNNAYEAIENNIGIVGIDLHEENRLGIITITDNGHGISSSNLKLLFQRGFSTKKEGHGLGLYHARETLHEWGANIEIISMLNYGTKIIIKIPLIEPPLWFVNQLSLLNEEIVVCIDDSLSVYQSWLERFKLYKGKPKLIYCPSKESFLVELESLKYKSSTYLIDYEFSSKTYQGFDFTNLILMLDNPKNRIFMVTSRSAEKNIQEYCIGHNIHIIPKNFSVKIPLLVFDNSKTRVVLTTAYDKEISILNNSVWHVYSNVNDFIADIPYFEPFYKIYVHRDINRTDLNIQLKIHNLNRISFKDISSLLEQEA